MCVNQKDPMLKRMKILIEQINEADVAYYKNDKPIMSDREYDALYDELKFLENTWGITLSNSPDFSVLIKSELARLV